MKNKSVKSNKKITNKKIRSVKRAGIKNGKNKNSYANQNENFAAEDIASLILRDHKPIKELILILKDPAVSMAKKVPAFADFERVLACHAKAEEESLYVYLKDDNYSRIEGLEGDIEHVIATQLMSEINERFGEDDIWMAKVKVLAELVDHHVRDEEKDVLKYLRKDLSEEMRNKIGEIYSRLHNKLQYERSAQKTFSSDEDDVAVYLKG